jgi:hypothetical protein
MYGKNTLRSFKCTPEAFDTIVALNPIFVGADARFENKVMDPSGVFVSYTCIFQNTWLEFNRDPRPENPDRWELISRDI